MRTFVHCCIQDSMAERPRASKPKVSDICAFSSIHPTQSTARTRNWLDLNHLKTSQNNKTNPFVRIEEKYYQYYRVEKLIHIRLHAIHVFLHTAMADSTMFTTWIRSEKKGKNDCDTVNRTLKKLHGVKRTKPTDELYQLHLWIYCNFHKPTFAYHCPDSLSQQPFPHDVAAIDPPVSSEAVSTEPIRNSV